jgi:hypothetical protein
MVEYGGAAGGAGGMVEYAGGAAGGAGGIVEYAGGAAGGAGGMVEYAGGAVGYARGCTGAAAVGAGNVAAPGAGCAADSPRQKTTAKPASMLTSAIARSGPINSGP